MSLLINRIRRLKRWLAGLRAHGDGQVRLHLGCGQDYWPGYVNIDRDDPNGDLRLDFLRIGEYYAGGSVAEAAMIHSLGYLSLWEARKLLAEVHRLLQPGGRLVIELPDLSKCARRILESEGDRTAYLEAVRAVYAFDLRSIERRAEYTPYAFGWSAWHLKQELLEIGFYDIQLLGPQTHGQRLWRDIRIEAYKQARVQM